VKKKMTRIEELLAIVDRHDLNRHPFYTAWREGKLPAEKLSLYAVDYDAFVGNIAEGWETLGFEDYATEEREHHRLWDEFSSAVASGGALSPRPQALILADVSRRLFESRPEAVGALFAFEAQQPETATVKLDGLREHYGFDQRAEKYFEEHAGKWHEVEALKHEVAKLSDEEFSRAKCACAILGAAMWLTLDGVLAA
jgi:pyrroloquinoline-quinone synthase